MILLATGSSTLQTAYRRQLQPYDHVLSVSSHASLRDAIERIAARLIFVDLAMAEFQGAAGVRRLIEKSPLSTVLLIAAELPRTEQLALMDAGAHGLCHPDMDNTQFACLFKKLERGERWIPGSTLAPAGKRISRGLEEETPTSRLFHLTYREKEIARLIGDGHSNATIAREVQIAERTVKAHLSDIFRKLEVENRRALAMRVVARC